MSRPQTVVIIGGGIIGCAAAYYITRHPLYDAAETTVTVLEASSIAGGASGKAGGLLATWAFPSELASLSFSEHVCLAKEHDGEARWGFRMLKCGQWQGRGQSSTTAADGPGMHGRYHQPKTDSPQLPPDLNWVDGAATESYSAFPDGQTAQVRPFHFTTAMLDLAKERGVRVVFGKALSIDSTHGRVNSVTYASRDHPGQNQRLPADCVLLAAGPWTPVLLPSAPMSHSRAHSITIRPGGHVSAHALFTGITLPNGGLAQPEIFPRVDEVYACGASDRLPLPPTSADVEVDAEKCDVIFEHVSSISPQLRAGEVTARQACYRPDMAVAGGPMIGPVPGISGLVLASGHTCWGIQNAPATAKVVAGLVMEGSLADKTFEKFSPGLFGCTF